MRLYLINPSNPLVGIAKASESRWARYRVWKPLSLMVLAGLTGPEWEITIFDENLGVPDYRAMARPDLVGITAFTSQVNRAYELASYFRNQGVPVVMGGIHTTMCVEEVMERVDSVVTGEAEGVWATVLEDALRDKLKRRYDGGLAEIKDMPAARHDLLSKGYAFGAIQTTRGCPLNCSFCSVSAFNGTKYRHRPIADVVREFRMIREKRVLVVDDNLIGTSAGHIARAKDLFYALAQANLRKKWIGQVTINFADDEELLTLASKAGCRGVYIGFESPSPEGLQEVGKKFNILKGRDFRASVQRIRRHNILVAGSFIMGLDVDEAGIGKRIAEAACQYGVDSLNTLFLTPLPGTQLWAQMKSQGRIALDRFPEDWKYYTLSFPIARYKHLSMEGIIKEMVSCEHNFYSMPRILRRVWSNFWRFREPLITLVGNFSYRSNIRLGDEAYSEFRRHCGSRRDSAKEYRRGPDPKGGATVRVAAVSRARSAGDGIRETEKFKS
ncbi:MAG: B12-binding domain-containing radical SAM protein [Sedimentisphaerales bacterium]|nr:B12-binding domain-containing radical SAM protein [Sedimentisphaerales bacterium]